VHLLVEDRVCGAPVRLGAVHRDVGVAQDLLRARAVAVADGDADAAGGEHLVAGEAERTLQLLEHALGVADRLSHVDEALEQESELVAAQARHRVDHPHRAPEPHREGDQQLVAEPVPEAVVDDLEAVEVEEEQGEAGARRPPAALQRHLQPVDEQRPVGQAG
jgi:hypothetical protein